MTTKQNTEKADPKTSQEQPQQPAKPVTDSPVKVKTDAKQQSPQPQHGKQGLHSAKGKRKNLQTPQPKNKEAQNSDKKGNTASTAKSSNVSHSGSGKPKYQKNQPQRRNFYNPPQKVLRHLAQQSYYENVYGNQSQFYTLKQKYKTQLCRHFTEKINCPLGKYC